MKVKKFELLSVEEMRNKYGLVSENRPALRLNREKVPEKLRHLIPYAEVWGVGDDLVRDDMVRKAPKQVVDELKRVIELNEDLLDDWLGGEEANNPNPSREYLAFSAMRMAADFA